MATTVSKKKTPTPQWYTALLPLARVGTSWKDKGSPEYITLSNFLKRQKLFGTIKSFTFSFSGNNATRVEWIARDPQFSGAA